MTVRVDVQWAAPGDKLPSEEEICRWTSQAVESVAGNAAAEIEVGVRIVDEDEGLELNRQYRQQARATNVLSFPADPLQPHTDDGGPRILGDIVICAPVVEREARDQGKDLDSHWNHLLVHGALHLLGYDHRTEDEARQMEALERNLLAARGISDPYSVG